LEDEIMCNEHRSRKEDFTRKRCLGFREVVVLILSKGLKSIQCLLNEFFLKLALPTVTKTAFCLARLKLSYTVFIELNNKAVVEVYYRNDDFLKYKGLRVLGIDSTVICLPESDELAKEFGKTDHTDGKGTTVTGSRPYARGSVMFDVLNRIAVDARLEKSKAYEVEIAVKHLSLATELDLILCDRGYASFRTIVEFDVRNIKFLIRCSKGSFKIAQEMYKGLGKDSQVVKLVASGDALSEMKLRGLRTEIEVRFVRIQLDTGENEILVTNLLSETEYPTPDFKELYWMRWGVETFYGVIKTRLCLENFTGFSVESVRQDFYSTIFLTGLESILTENAEEILSQKQVKNPQIVNKVISFNAIKNQAMEILCGKGNEKEAIEKLTALFLTNPTQKRPHRKPPPRRKESNRRLLNFHKYKKKIVF